MAQNRIIIALDFPSAQAALELVDRLDPRLCRLKVGKELFTRCGPALVRELTGRGYDVFLDLKYHDIPNTVAAACRAAADLGAWMVNVHALGGRAMMSAAREALEGAAQRPLLIAVTILTSLGDRELAEIGLQGGARENALRLAVLAREAGLDGVVCSAHEARGIKSRCGQDFLCVTPGVRPAGAGRQDQKRVATPSEAMALGADYLVVGRPVTAAAEPARALNDILKETEGVLAG
ncbi:MAG TPA: orotidine-5'-phosphate decarboxylase [Gammaproteobacteria bacterium]|nr:orotidine-5'-phosphate decarboxylase [Gammaproteobacteria bacterium]